MATVRWSMADPWIAAAGAVGLVALTTIAPLRNGHAT